MLPLQRHRLKMMLLMNQLLIKMIHVILLNHRHQPQLMKKDNSASSHTMSSSSGEDVFEPIQNFLGARTRSGRGHVASMELIVDRVVFLRSSAAFTMINLRQRD